MAHLHLDEARVGVELWQRHLETQNIGLDSVKGEHDLASIVHLKVSFVCVARSVRRTRLPYCRDRVKKSTRVEALKKKSEVGKGTASRGTFGNIQNSLCEGHGKRMEQP